MQQEFSLKILDKDVLFDCFSSKQTQMEAGMTLRCRGIEYVTLESTAIDEMVVFLLRWLMHLIMRTELSMLLVVIRIERCGSVVQ